MGNSAETGNIDLPDMDLTAMGKLWDTIHPFLIKLMWAAVMVIVGYIILKLLIKLANNGMKHTKVDDIIHKYVINCLKTVVFVVLIISVLSYLGVPVTSMIAVISAAGVAVALALQGSLSNLAAGILIILTKPFSKGDLIDNLSISGKVEEINLMNCKLHTLDNKTIIIPNGSLINGTIVNYSSSGLRRVETLISIGYEDNVQLAKDILGEIAKDNPLILEIPPMVVGVKAHSASSIDLDFMVWCHTSDYLTVFYYIQEETLKRFRNQGLHFPYPQMDVHLKKETALEKMTQES